MLCDTVSKTPFVHSKKQTELKAMPTLEDNPLWHFALRLYPNAQATLLKWQDEEGIHVNDLLWATYVKHRNQGVAIPTWQRLERSRYRRLLRRVRQLRYSLPRDHSARPLALKWELMLEQWDLAALNDCVIPSKSFNSDLYQWLATQWGMESKAVEKKVAWLAELIEER